MARQSFVPVLAMDACRRGWQGKQEHVCLQAQPRSPCLLWAVGCHRSHSSLSPQPCMSHQALSFSSAVVELPPHLLLLLLPWSEPWVGVGTCSSSSIPRAAGWSSNAAPRGSGKRPVGVSCVFRPVFRWLEQGSLRQPWDLTLLHHPPRCFTHPDPAGRRHPRDRFPRRNPEPGREGAAWGNPKYNPAPILTPCCNCSALLPYLTLNFWDYSPVPWVTFLLLNEHSGSESDAFLGTAALGASLPGLPVGMGTGREAQTPSAPPALRDGEPSSRGGWGSAAPGRDFG